MENIVLSQIAYGQNTLKITIKDSLTKEPLYGATAVLKGTTNGSSANINGEIEIKNIPNGQHRIVFGYIGYQRTELTFTFPLEDSLQKKIIFLKINAQEMNEVTVTTTRTNTRVEDSPIRVEVIGEEEVNEEVNIKPTNISKLLLESSSIQAQQTSAINGNVSLRLQGLDGKYTQILKDGFPLYGGFSQGLSIMQIPPLDLKQIEIIKGSASSIYGSDAIAGIINLISKQPKEKREFTFLINQTSLLGTNVNSYFSHRWKKFGITFLSANSFQKEVDVNKNGFSDLPKTQTFSLNPTFYYYFNSTTTLQFGLNGNHDYREGGDLKVLENKSDTVHRFFEENLSSRISSQLKFEKKYNDQKSLTVKNSISYFDRAINQSTSAFRGNQVSSYSEIAYSIKKYKHQLVSGVNFSTEQFSEDISKSHLKRNYNYNTAGIFLQDDFRAGEKIIFNCFRTGRHK